MSDWSSAFFKWLLAELTPTEIRNLFGEPSGYKGGSSPVEGINPSGFRTQDGQDLPRSSNLSRRPYQQLMSVLDGKDVRWSLGDNARVPFPWWRRRPGGAINVLRKLFTLIGGVPNDYLQAYTAAISADGSTVAYSIEAAAGESLTAGDEIRPVAVLIQDGSTLAWLGLVKSSGDHYVCFKTAKIRDGVNQAYDITDVPTAPTWNSNGHNGTYVPYLTSISKTYRDYAAYSTWRTQSQLIGDQAGVQLDASAILGDWNAPDAVIRRRWVDIQVDLQNLILDRSVTPLTPTSPPTLTNIQDALSQDFGSPDAYVSRYLMRGTWTTILGDTTDTNSTIRAPEGLIWASATYYPYPYGDGYDLWSIWYSPDYWDAIQGGIVLAYDADADIYYMQRDYYFSNGSQLGMANRILTYQDWLNYAYAHAAANDSRSIGTTLTQLLDSFDHAGYRAASGVDSDPFAYVDPMNYAGSYGWGGWRLEYNDGVVAGPTPFRQHASFTSGGAIFSHGVESGTWNGDDLNNAWASYSGEFYYDRQIIPNGHNIQLGISGQIALFLHIDYDPSAYYLENLVAFTWDFSSRSMLGYKDLIPELGFSDGADYYKVLFLADGDADGTYLLVLSNDARTEAKIVEVTRSNDDASDPNAVSISWSASYELDLAEISYWLAYGFIYSE